MDISDSWWTDWGSLAFKWMLLVAIPVLYYWLWSRSTFVQLVNAIPGPRPIPFLGNVLDLYVDRDGECLQIKFAPPTALDPNVIYSFRVSQDRSYRLDS